MPGTGFEDRVNELLQEGSRAVQNLGQDLGAVVHETYKSIKPDVETVINQGEKKLKDAIGTAVKEGYVREVYSGVMDVIKAGASGAVVKGILGGPKGAVVGGFEKAKQSVREKWDHYDAQLDDLVMEKPGQVGFFDGFANVFAGTPCDRRPRSPKYASGVAYGKTAGWSAAVTALCTDGVALTIIGAIPIIQKVSPYMRDKVSEAYGKVQEGK